MKRYIFQAYGNEGFHRMALLSISSLIRNCDVAPSDISILTDRAKFYPENCDIIHASKKLIKKWQGPLFFHHRVKIKLIQHIARELSFDEMLYLDADTYMVSSPSSVNKHSVLFDEEDKDFPEDWMHDYRKHSNTESDMWCAGVIGLRHHEIAEICKKALVITDAISLAAPKKIEWSEQYAFSSACYGMNKVTATDSIIHYWDSSREIEALLMKLSYNEIQNMDHSQFLEMEQCAQLDRKNSTENRSWRRNFKLRKLKRSLKKRKRELYAHYYRLISNHN